LSIVKNTTKRRKTSISKKKENATTVRKLPVVASVSSKIEERYNARLRGLKFLFVQKVVGKKELTEEELLGKLLQDLPMNKKQLIAYLVRGEISEMQRTAIRDAAVSLWSKLKQYSGREVDWSFINSELGVQGYAAILDLRK
jgi:hypothetical protein